MIDLDAIVDDKSAWKAVQIWAGAAPLGQSREYECSTGWDGGLFVCVCLLDEYSCLRAEYVGKGSTLAEAMRAALQAAGEGR